jgi:AcrR family transcriptional regulator
VGESVVTGATPRSQRRRAEIAASAAQLFCELGFHRVGIDDVAASVGITGGAIYRHFANKQDLLARTVTDVHDLIAEVLATTDGLDETLEGLAALALEQRTAGVTLLREARHLVGDAREVVLRRGVVLSAVLVDRLRAERPELSAPDARTVVESLLAVYSSVSFQHIVLPRGTDTELLGAMARTVARTPLLRLPPPDRSGAPRTNGEVPQVAVRASRREMLLDAAIQLFGRRGYTASRMEDVGAAADIAGPSIYQHFDSKADLLMAALTRGAEGLELDLSRSLAQGDGPEDCLRLLVVSYVEFMLRQPDLVRLLMDEALYLPDAEQESLRRIQLRYVREWVNLLIAARPGISEPVGRFLTQGVFSIVNDVARHRITDVERYRALLVTLSTELLLGPDWAEAPA